MEGRPSRAAFLVHRSLSREAFPRVKPWLVRTLLFRIPVRALFPCSLSSEPFPSPRAVPSRPTMACAHSPVPNPCPRAVPSARSFARAMLLRSKGLPVHRSLALKSGPCAVPPFLRSEPSPVPRYAFPSIRALARASFPSRRLVSVRQMGVCAMFKDRGSLSRLHESRAGLQHRLLATALERWVRRLREEFLTLFLLLVSVVQLHFDNESC